MEKLTYEEALAKLEKTVAEIENPDASLESVMDKVKESVELLEFCRESLRENEEKINKIVKFEE